MATWVLMGVRVMIPRFVADPRASNGWDELGISVARTE